MPEDRVARFARRLLLGIDAGTIACPSVEVSVEDAIDFTVRQGGRLTVARQGWWRSRHEEVSAVLDMDRHALIFESTSSLRRIKTSVACYKIRRVYFTITCDQASQLEPAAWPRKPV